MRRDKFVGFLYEYFIIAIISEVVSTSGLRWITVNVPQYRIPGESAKLQCKYDLGNDTLYSVKWYKEHEEFFRFVPKARPQKHSYKTDGIQVDMSVSNDKDVVLRNVNYRTSGLYRCEVSAEAPSFSSAQAEARMEVVSLPEEDPQITGVEPPYQIDDEINLNCTSGKSHPASVLHWYINEEHVVNPSELIHYPNQQIRHGPVSSTLGLRFILKTRHFVGGAMKVKCVAFVSPVLWRGDSESIVKSSPVSEMREALLLVKGAGSKTPTWPPAILINLCILLIMTIRNCSLSFPNYFNYFIYNNNTNNSENYVITRT